MHETPPDTINALVLAGDFGFNNVEGPFSVEKTGTNWAVRIPTDQDDYAAPNCVALTALEDAADKAAVLIADGVAVGGGLVTDVMQLDGSERGPHLCVTVDQYARGDPMSD